MKKNIYNYLYKKNITKMKVRRALLKAVAAPGHQYKLTAAARTKFINHTLYPDKNYEKKYIHLFKDLIFYN